MDLHTAQQLAWENKLDKGFNTTDVGADFGRVRGEIDEAQEAWDGGGEGFGHEAADVAIYLCGLAEMNGLNLADEAERTQTEPFTVADVSDGLEQLRGQVTKAEQAWRDGELLGAGLAGSLACLCTVAETAGLDLGQQIEDKLAIIADRLYERGPGGQLVKVRREADHEAG
jgi:NTP pyrophosphatase (non-canonical NTP hydrolase)